MKKNLVTVALTTLVLSGTVMTTTPAVKAATTASSDFTISFSLPHQQFIQKIAPVAQKAAKQYGLYPSVMMAQAILESDWGHSTASQAPNNNYFGIKGTYKGASQKMNTQEWAADTGYYTINANFRKYPSLLASFMDNGAQLRQGLDDNTAYYSGTWRENAATYQDATANLQGRYATDQNYADKLNQIIDTYNLTQYDGPQTKATKPIASGPTFKVQPLANQGKIHLYSPLGVSLPGQTLKANTNYHCDQIRYINGQKFYRVYTYAWVQADDVTVLS